MANRMMVLLERAAGVRRVIESRSRDVRASDLQLLRLARLSLLIRRHLGRCIETTLPARQAAVALARSGLGANAPRH